MFRRIRKHANPASLLAMVALFVALGGVSYAAATINGKDIKNKSVAGKKLKNKTVTGGKVKNDSLTGVQINESTLGKVPVATQADSATNAQTAQSAATVAPNGVGAAAIQDGSIGHSKLAAVTTRTDSVDVADGATGTPSVSCEAGELPLSGGVTFGGAAINAAQALNTHLVRSGPTSNGWSVRVYNGTGTSRTYTVSVVCLAG